MKHCYRLVFIFLFSIKAFSCDCKIPKKALEFYESEYVFEGKVISKYYSSDLSKYSIKVEVLKHFKKNIINPRYIEFTFRSEHNNNKNSCDFIIDKFERLLIYSKKNNKNLSFNFSCSNSKRITNKRISHKELKFLNNANNFDVSKYIYTDASGFSYSNPITSIDSIINSINLIDLSLDNYTSIIIDIDE